MAVTTNANYAPVRRQKIELSKHARLRCQQRGIEGDLVFLIRTFGEREYDGKGGVRFLMTAASIARLERSLGHSKRVARLEGTYVVLDAETESTVITASHRHA